MFVTPRYIKEAKTKEKICIVIYFYTEKIFKFELFSVNIVYVLLTQHIVVNKKRLVITVKIICFMKNCSFLPYPVIPCSSIPHVSIPCIWKTGVSGSSYPET